MRIGDKFVDNVDNVDKSKNSTNVEEIRSKQLL